MQLGRGRVRVQWKWKGDPEADIIYEMFHMLIG